MSFYQDLVEDPSVKDQMYDFFIDQLHLIAETYYEDNSPFATPQTGPVAQRIRATAF